MAIILPDGLSNSCHEEDQHISIGSDLYRYDEVCIFVYDMHTLDIINLEHIKIPSHLRITANTVDDNGKKVLVTWPSNGAIITSNNVDFHFYLRKSELLKNITIGQQLCLYIKSTTRVQYNAHHCVEPQQQYFTTPLLNAKYEVVWYVKQPPSSLDSENIETNSNSISISNIDNDSMEEVQILNTRSFEVFDLSPKIPLVGNVVENVNVNIVDVDIDMTIDDIGTDIDINMNIDLDIGIDMDIDIDVGVDRDTMHVVLLSCRSLDRYREAETMIKSLIYNRNGGNDRDRDEKHTHSAGQNPDPNPNPTPIPNPRPLVLHMILDPSGKRYMDDMWSANGIETNTILDWESVRDPNQSNQSKKSEDSYSISAYTLNTNITIVVHDYKSVCQEPLDHLFRDKLDDHSISFHHSGAAGYCRLFLPDYFAKIRKISRRSGIRSRSDAFNTNTNANTNSINTNTNTNTNPVHTYGYNTSYIFPSNVIMAIETDQLILAPIDDLWNHHIAPTDTYTHTHTGPIRGIRGMSGIYDLTEGVLVSAAENYQPWYVGLCVMVCVMVCVCVWGCMCNICVI